MKNRTSIVLISAALVAGLSGFAQAEDAGAKAQKSVIHSTRSAAAAQRKLLTLRDYAQAKPEAAPQAACTSITCGSYVVIGIGF